MTKRLFTRYRFCKVESPLIGGYQQGTELWMWIMWSIAIAGLLVIGSYSVGKISEMYVHNSVIRGMYYELSHACDQKVELDTEKPAEYDSTGKRIN